jgi:LysM repeat protein
MHAPRLRSWWLVPAIGLLPVLLAVLATQGAFNRAPSPAATTVAGAPTMTSGAAAPPLQANTATATVAAVAAAQPTAGVSAPAAPTPAASAAAPIATTSTTPASTPSSSSSTPAASGAANQPFITYHVKAGDTMRFIAQTYGVSAASIAQASGLSNPDELRVGQVLTIPTQPGWLYRVQPGESLDQIAARTGVSTDRIASASGLSIASVSPGDVLLIPDQSAAASK